MSGASDGCPPRFGCSDLLCGVSLDFSSSAEDYRNYRNGYYVPDHKDYYRFGESKRIKTVPLFRKALKDLIDRWSSFAANEGGSPLYLVSISALFYLSSSRNT